MKCSTKDLKGLKVLIVVGEFDVPYADVPENVKYEKFVGDALASKNIPSEIMLLEHKDFSEEGAIQKKILKAAPDVVFNLFEGFYDDSSKEPIFAEILEEMNVPFTGNTSYALRACLNKNGAKEILKHNGVPVPDGFVIKNGNDLEKATGEFPYFLKPVAEDASLGIDKESLVNSKEEMRVSAEKKLKMFPAGILAEEFLPGKEYNVGMLGSGEYEIFGVSSIDYAEYAESTPFLTYGSKWDEASEEYRKTIPVFEKGIEPVKRRKIAEIAEKAARALKCRGYFRVDLREKSDKICVIDVNPNPDISPGAGFATQAGHRGYTYPDIVEKILEMAWER